MAAVIVFNEMFPIEEIGPRDNLIFQWVEIGDIRIYDCYWTPYKKFTLYLEYLDRIEASIRSEEGLVIVTGDFKAKYLD